MIERQVFHAMGTDVELLVRGARGTAADAMARAVDEFERLEQCMSRFRPDSELSTLNREGVLDASPDLLQVVELALAARRRTDGRFDPTVHDALVAAGYDRTFDELLEDRDAKTVAPAPCNGSVGVEGSRIVLGEGVKLDLGGIGKGYAAERAAELLGSAGPCLVNAGGDIAVRGDEAWPIGVATAEGILTIEVEGCGLATSGRDRRRWRCGSEEQHHLIDPSKGRPAASDLLRVTVVAEDAVEAEVQAKALFLAGEQDASQTDLTAVVVTDDGRTLLTGALG